MRGWQFALVFARQSGTEGPIAQLVAYLLTLYQSAGGEVGEGQGTGRRFSALTATLSPAKGCPCHLGQQRLDRCHGRYTRNE